jgi:serine/threonine-protein kinase
LNDDNKTPKNPSTLVTRFGLSTPRRPSVEELLLGIGPGDETLLGPPGFDDTEATTLPRTDWGEESIVLEPVESRPELTLPPAGALSDRYDDLGRIGMGGMGEVRRMRDRRLGRTVAMKFLRPELATRDTVVARFLGEAQIAAQLQHPGLVPVHDVGRLPDGRVWFTMKEVEGLGLDVVLADVHDVSVERWRAGQRGWTLHRLVEAFATVCEATGYAHSRGVIHRDLKPENIMVGEYGEVLVLDWGIAKVLSEAVEEEDETTIWTTRSESESFRTRHGAVAGTVMYMAPEQVRGEVDQLDSRTDVYALGALLYEVLTGSPPYNGRRAVSILNQVLAGPPMPVPERLREQGREVVAPPELVALAERAMSARQEDRPPDGAALATSIREWLEGAAREASALELVRAAAALGPSSDALRVEAQALRGEARNQLDAIPTWASEDEKAAGWAMEDRADRLEEEADQLVVRAELSLGTALSYAPDLPAIHEALVRLYREEHRLAEVADDAGRAARAEVRLSRHADALPLAHPERSRTSTYLSGAGSLTLVTEPPGAEVMLYRCVERRRRRVLEPERFLGVTPLEKVPVEPGSWVCELRVEGRAMVRYPIHITRGFHWDGVAPGGQSAEPLMLPAEAEVGPKDCVVPAGWFVAGGDAAATGSLPRKVVWCDGFVMRAQPVSFREYLVFLDDLMQQGRTAEALAATPCTDGSDHSGSAVVEWVDGQFVMPPTWTLDHPVLMVPWDAAMAYAAWESARTGQSWRLPGELEWEKAGRGVDGRLFPWGDHFDASWAALEDSHEGEAKVLPIATFPTDVSVYGVRGLAGNVRDWCLDAWIPDGPTIVNGRVPPADPGPVDCWKVRRGGSWGDMPGRARLADRDWYNADRRSDYLGFRLARSL